MNKFVFELIGIFLTNSFSASDSLSPPPGYSDHNHFLINVSHISCRIFVNNLQLQKYPSMFRRFTVILSGLERNQLQHHFLLPASIWTPVLSLLWKKKVPARTQNKIQPLLLMIINKQTLVSRRVRSVLLLTNSLCFHPGNGEEPGEKKRRPDGPWQAQEQEQNDVLSKGGSVLVFYFTFTQETS